MSKPVFSVIVPVYNREKLVEKTLASVLAQQFRDFEFILVDDGSTDGTLDVLKKYEGENVRVFSIPNGERSAARNYGVSVANGQYITFLDSDDVFYPDHLENASAFCGNGDLPWFAVRYELTDEETGQKRAVDYPLGNPLKSLWKGNFLSCCGVFLKREIASEFPFDPALTLMEDWNLWLRLSCRYPLAISAAEPSAALIIHSERSVTGDEFAAKLEAKVHLFLESVRQSVGSESTYKKYRHLLQSSCQSYIALHLLLQGEKRKAVPYFLRSLRRNPYSILNKRSAAIVKRLFFSFEKP